MLPQTGHGQFVFMGKSRKPQTQVTCEQYAQCQLQMLVADVDSCDLISYSLDFSTIFHISRDDRWLAIALEILAHMNTKYIQIGKQPTADALMTDKPHLHKSFMSTTRAAMHRLARQPTSEVKSAVNLETMQPYFLDGEAGDDERRLHVGAPTCPCLHLHFSLS